MGDSKTLEPVCLQGGALRASPGLNTNYMTYINDFQTKRLILDLEVSLDRAHQKNVPIGNLLRVTPKTLELRT